MRDSESELIAKLEIIIIKIVYIIYDSNAREFSLVKQHLTFSLLVSISLSLFSPSVLDFALNLTTDD